MDGNRANSFLVHKRTSCHWYNRYAEQRAETVELFHTGSVDMHEECCGEECDAEEVEENTGTANVCTFINYIVMLYHTLSDLRHNFHLDYFHKTSSCCHRPSEQIEPNHYHKTIFAHVGEYGASTMGPRLTLFLEVLFAYLQAMLFLASSSSTERLQECFGRLLLPEP